MSKLEEIKERNRNLVSQIEAHENSYEKEFFINTFSQPLADMGILLSIIEQAEKAFEEIKYQVELHEFDVVRDSIEKIDKLATIGLKFIYGEE